MKKNKTKINGGSSIPTQEENNSVLEMEVQRRKKRKTTSMPKNCLILSNQRKTNNATMKKKITKLDKTSLQLKTLNNKICNVLENYICQRIRNLRKILTTSSASTWEEKFKKKVKEGRSKDRN